MARAAATAAAVAESEPLIAPRIPPVEEYFRRIAIEQLSESPLNPRKTFNPATLQELAASILSKGIVEPLVVRVLGGDFDDDSQFEIICGARRYRAAKLAGLFHLPVVVRPYSDAQALEIMAIENGQRDDVPPLEEAAGYKQLLLVDQTYTPAMIAQRIGHTERYVYDRMRLLDLVPELQAHLEAGRIGVEHAELLAKLKPGEQRRAANPSAGALFEPDYALKYDDDAKPFAHKVRSVRQLREWIARNVRFDVQHAAQTAPLEFAATAEKVAAAEAGEGRGKKVVPITFDAMCPQGAKDDERTYGASAWKRATGKDGQPTCEYAVLGLVVAGEHQGDSFHVCIARDRCERHWKDQVAAKAKAEKLRASGKGTRAAKVEKAATVRTEEKWQRDERERRARYDAWTAIEGDVLDEAARQVKGATAITAAQAAALEKDPSAKMGYAAMKKHLGVRWFTSPAAALLVSGVTAFVYVTWDDSKGSGLEQFVRTVAKPFGLDVKKIRAAAEQLQPKAAAAAPTSGSHAKKASATKAAKRR